MVVPVFILFVLAVIQLSLAFVWFYSQTSVARDTARWLAINSDSTDDRVAERVRQTLLPGLVGGPPQLVSAGTRTQDTEYRIGNMRTWFTPCLFDTGSQTCTHADRAAGATLHVTMSYDASNILFLPARFHLGWMELTLPTSLPSYTVFVMAE